MKLTIEKYEEEQRQKVLKDKNEGNAEEMQISASVAASWISDEL